MSDLFTVSIAGKTAQTARLLLRPLDPESATVFVSPGFAGLLLADEGAPHAAAWARWVAAQSDADPDFDWQAGIAAIAVEPSEGGHQLTLTADLPGLFDALEVGSSWGSAAFDERGDGPPLPASGRALWTRPAPAITAPSTLGLEVVEALADGAVFRVVTAGALPATDPDVWFKVLQWTLSSLRDLHPREASQHIHAIELLAVAGERDLTKGKVSIDNALQIKARGALEARYRVHGSGPAWAQLIAGSCLMTPLRAADALLAAPAPGAEGDLEEFDELLEMSAEDGDAAVLEMLVEGLTSARPVVLDALARIAARGADAAGSAHAVGRLVGSADGGVALAALQTLAALGTDAATPYRAFGCARLDPAVASAARALG